MMTIAVVAGLIAGTIHVGFWLAESMLWKNSAIQRLFGVRNEYSADAMAGVLFNLGFYNLFLGAGAIAGAVGVAHGHWVVLLTFCCLFMVAAGLVLLVTSRGLWRGTVVQALPAAVALIALAGG